MAEETIIKELLETGKYWTDLARSSRSISKKTSNFGYAITSYAKLYEYDNNISHEKLISLAEEISDLASEAKKSKRKKLYLLVENILEFIPEKKDLEKYLLHSIYDLKTNEDIIDYFTAKADTKGTSTDSASVADNIIDNAVPHDSYKFYSAALSLDVSCLDKLVEEIINLGTADTFHFADILDKYVKDESLRNRIASRLGDYANNQIYVSPSQILFNVAFRFATGDMIKRIAEDMIQISTYIDSGVMKANFAVDALEHMDLKDKVDNAVKVIKSCSDFVRTSDELSVYDTLQPYFEGARKKSEDVARFIAGEAFKYNSINLETQLLDSAFRYVKDQPDVRDSLAEKIASEGMNYVHSSSIVKICKKAIEFAVSEKTVENVIMQMTKQIGKYDDFDAQISMFTKAYKLAGKNKKANEIITKKIIQEAELYNPLRIHLRFYNLALDFCEDKSIISNHVKSLAEQNPDFKDELLSIL